ncbi:PhoB family transcriptional regulator [Planococcus glaciei]|uniref:Response regulator transcription factor n=1 Tax=Planococcus glaciei TaxID=459472 RepID=A0A7H8QBD7_9BACL|nr:response regulator transcription factor [Planococcus glaciei]MCP2035630.1 DNA-binding response OmpR family regulator [Planomicrobium sp. HSC-17F08]KOF10515.1 PhoB family transcriptional regulator [Planococcus glaciei]MBX0316428.1 response regulator transcription factor [Planococcus glaciei]QDY45926.1 response regulator transcription factor [Planococcus glaciei]QKX51179.1 response regulator transcription factor [Planococcus glaciei]
MFKIMIVEDDETIAGILKEELQKWNYEAFAVDDFNRVLDVFKEQSPQLILLDIQLPSFNGYYWCQEIRKISQVPIIFVSSRNENMDIVMAIQMGADDFIAKPFDLTVAIAKTQALLRRTYDFNEADNFLNFNRTVLKPGESKLYYEKREVDLTRTELKILELLFLQKGEYVTREEIMIQLWEDESFIDDNTLAVNVARLRKKLAQVELTDFIVTKKGIGYALNKEAAHA